MILECSECRTRYLVPDSAIGADGRTVRCASCKHSWFQAGVVLDLVERAEAPGAPRSAPPVTAPPVAAPSVATPVATAPAAAAPAAAPPPSIPPVSPSPARVEPAYGFDDDNDYDAFAHRAPFRPRRNPARQWTVMAIAAGIAMLIGVGALFYSDVPGLASRLGLPLTPAETPLTLVTNKLDRRDLVSGSQLFAVSGKVVNPTDTRQSVPDIRAELHDAQDRLVYSWTIRPDATSLPPRGTVEFNSAKLDVPVNSKNLKLSFADEVTR